MKQTLFILLVLASTIYSSERKAPDRRNNTPGIKRHLNNDVIVHIDPELERSAEDKSPSPEAESNVNCECRSGCSRDTKIIIGAVSTLVSTVVSAVIILANYYVK